MIIEANLALHILLEKDIIKYESREKIWNSFNMEVNKNVVLSTVGQK